MKQVRSLRKASLVDAKAHLSKLVDDVEHHGQRVLILRHGKPAAALVPATVVLTIPPTKKLSRQARDELYAALGPGDASYRAVDDLLTNRR